MLDVGIQLFPLNSYETEGSGVFVYLFWITSIHR